MMKLKESSTEIDGLVMRYTQAGDGLPLLLIHGLLGGSFCWRFAIPALAQRYAVCAVDLPGASQSQDRAVDCSISCQAARLSQFIRQMGWRELAVMGSSFGGAIAMHLAFQEQKRGSVRSLVLAAPVNPWSSNGQGRIRLLSSRFGG